MRVFIVNVGQQNYLWPDCLARNTVATVDNVAVHHFWDQRDRKGYIEHALAHLKTARNETPTRAVASRWYGLMEAITETGGDIWIHREKEQLWWTTSLGDPVQTERRPSFNAVRDGPEIFELHKPCEPWSDRNRKGGKLSWDGLHPKAKDFLFTEGTLQQLAPDNAAYALALIAGDDLSGWHNQPTWQAKSDRAGRSAVTSFSPAQRAAWRMADTALATVAQSNGQQALRTIKNKDCLFTREELREYIQSLILDQDELCAITGIPLQFDGAQEDSELLASLDRIDSNGHYERGNLQVVCRFVNRWKSDARDEEFRRLIELVRTSRF
ncbi:MAG: hypothetical protein KF842_04630 [Caulobacter sp.]|nr:hypothetical protein [Caulobacter sp.]